MYDWTGISFPTGLRDIDRFERLNNVSINVYGLDNYEQLFSLRPTRNHIALNTPKRRFDLLYLTRPANRRHRRLWRLSVVVVHPPVVIIPIYVICLDS